MPAAPASGLQPCSSSCSLSRDYHLRTKAHNVRKPLVPRSGPRSGAASTMADPLSVAASVVGLLTAAAQITQTLTKITKNIKGAPEQCQHVCAEVEGIKQILEQLQSFILGISTASRSRASLILVEQVLVTLTSCVTTFSDIDTFVELLDSDVSLGLMDRLRWMAKAKDLSEVITRLQMHKSSLGVMLGILTWFVARFHTSTVALC